MPDVDNTTLSALIAELRNLTNTLKSGGNLGAGSDLQGSADTFQKSVESSSKAYAKAEILQKRQNEAYKMSTEGILGSVHAMKKLSEGTESYAIMTDLARRHMSDMVQTMSSDDLEDAATRYKQTLEQSSDEWAREIGKSINGAEDFLAAQRMLSENAVADFKLAKKLDKRGEKEKATKLLAKYNMTLKDLDKTSKEFRDTTKEMAMATADTSAPRGGNKLMALGKKLGVYLTVFIEGVKMLAKAAGALAKTVLTLTSNAAKFGVQIDEAGAAWAAMNTAEFYQLQAENRRIMNANNMSLAEWTDKIYASADGLIEFTGSQKDAIRFAAESMNMATVLGANQEQFMSEQETLFIKLNRGISMTTDQFMEMNKRLMDSESVQSQLYRLNVKQRSAFMLDLQNTYRKLTLDGLTHEQAQKMLEVFAEIGAKSPRERLKEAAKLQAVMGAMGMGAMGAEAGGLLRGGLRGRGDQERFAEIMRQANIGVGDRMGQGFASEMMTMQMIQTAGLDKYLGPSSDFADFNIRQEATIKEQFLEQQEQTRMLGGAVSVLDDIMRISDQINSFLNKDLSQQLWVMYQEGKKLVEKLTDVNWWKEVFRDIFPWAGPLTDLLNDWLGIQPEPEEGGVAKAEKREDMGLFTRAAVNSMEAGLNVGNALAEWWTGEKSARTLAIEAAAKEKQEIERRRQKQEAEQKKQIEQERNVEAEKLTILRAQRDERIRANDEARIARKKQLELQQQQLAEEKKTKKAVEDGTEQARKQAEDESKDKDKGYRLLWARAAGNAR